MTDSLSAITTLPPEEDLESTPTSDFGWRRTWSRFRRKKLAMAALCFIIVMTLLGILAPWIAPYSLGSASSDYMASPSGAHLLGTDNIGYDTFSQLLFGIRTSLLASVVAVTLALTGGLVVGLCAGFFGGRTDQWLMRFMEAIMIIPELILAIVIIGILGPSVINATIALAIATVPGFSRLIRGQVYVAREEGYVDAARVIGTRSPRIMRRHIIPNILPFLVVQVCMSLGLIMLAEGGLAFLGLSAQPPDVSLGSLLQNGFASINTTVRLILVPGVAITSLALAFNLVADGLRDALARHDTSDLIRARAT